MCLLCHGFYAATDDIGRVAAMYAWLPDGHLAIRTGRASNVVVLDVEPTNRVGENNPRDWGRLPAGLDVLDHWEEWVGGWSLPTTLTARSVSGGVHLFLRYPDVKVPTGGYVLPNVEVKSDGNYVGVPCGRNDRIITNLAPIAPMPRELVALLTTAHRVGGGGNGTGYVGAAGGGDQLPPTEEFITNGLGWVHRLAQPGRVPDRLSALDEARRRERRARRRTPVLGRNVEPARVVVARDRANRTKRRSAHDDRAERGRRVRRGLHDRRVAVTDDADLLIGLEYGRDDEGNARRLAHYERETLRYAKARDQWFNWDGRRWNRSTVGDMIAVGRRVVAGRSGVARRGALIGGTSTGRARFNTPVRRRPVSRCR
jgi:hypothetical protein